MTTGLAGSRPNAIIIVGAGAQGVVVADILQCAYKAGTPAAAIGFVDDTPELLGSSVLGMPVLGPLASLASLAHDAVIVAMGDNRARREITGRLLTAGERLATAIHPRATVATSAVVGAGSIICAGAIIGPLAMLGTGVLVNTGASVDHHSILEDFSHVSAGATVGGRVRIGTEALVAIGAVVVSERSVGPRTIVGAGAVVVSSLPGDVVALGVPARIRRHRQP